MAALLWSVERLRPSPHLAPETALLKPETRDRPDRPESPHTHNDQSGISGNNLLHHGVLPHLPKPPLMRPSLPDWTDGESPDVPYVTI